jgi:hypothetical protein
MLLIFIWDFVTLVLQGNLNFRHPYIWMRGIRGVWLSDTIIFCIQIYGCLNFRHPYILNPDIGVRIPDTPYILYSNIL